MAIDYFLMGELSKTSKRIVGDKSPLLTPGTKEIARIYPRQGIIHIIRDGRTQRSPVHHSWNFGKFRKGARRRRNAVRSQEDPRDAQGGG